MALLREVNLSVIVSQSESVPSLTIDEKLSRDVLLTRDSDNVIKNNLVIFLNVHKIKVIQHIFVRVKSDRPLKDWLAVEKHVPI